MLEGFLIGTIATSSLACGLFFLKYWKHTHDTLFLAFAIAFMVEGLNRISFMFLTRPNEGSPVIYIIRLCVFLLILSAILQKNYGKA